MSPRSSRPTGRPAFTLIEVVVVVGIIGVMISLLLPAIQSSREQARRVSCQNNLLQLGTALASYASSYGVLPPGVVNDKGPITGKAGGYRFGWAVQILPFLQEDAIHRQFDFRHGVDAPANSTARLHGIRTFVCPSNNSTGPMAYAACHHDVEALIDAGNHGVFYLNSRIRYDDITDGPAFTIFLGDSGGSGMPGGWAVGDMSTLRNTGTPVNGGPVVPLPGGYAVYRYDSEEQKAAEAAAEEEFRLNARVGGFSSSHRAGANFLFGDGSVRFLNDSTDARVYRRLGHRADGELIDGDDF
jgi:prepilin-type N-terminal cleavage/methylation domain-containing protein/prepilin-type processing-associated H-X9-DG protein